MDNRLESKKFYNVLLRNNLKSTSKINFIDDSESESADSSSGGSDTDEASGPFHPFADLSRGDSSELLAQLRAIPDMDYSLSWIQRSLNRTAEDREDGKDCLI